MTDMYSIIMELPLFKGISREQVSAFLEKTSIEFLNFKSGDIILEAGTISDYIYFTISGETEITWKNTLMGICISYTLSSGNVFGSEWLYGMHREIPLQAAAKGNVAIMRVSKKEYMALLDSSQVYQLNFLNYISLKMQRADYSLRNLDLFSLKGFLCTYMLSIVPSDARDISFIFDATNGSHSSAAILHCEEDMKGLEDKGLTQRIPHGIRIISRKKFLEHCL